MPYTLPRRNCSYRRSSDRFPSKIVSIFCNCKLNNCCVCSCGSSIVMSSCTVEVHIRSVVVDCLIFIWEAIINYSLHGTVTPLRSCLCFMKYGQTHLILPYIGPLSGCLCFAGQVFIDAFLKYMIRIAGNFGMMQIFAYFEHMQIVRKLEPTIIFTQNYDITQFFPHIHTHTLNIRKTQQNKGTGRER